MFKTTSLLTFIFSEIKGSFVLKNKKIFVFPSLFKTMPITTALMNVVFEKSDVFEGKTFKASIIIVNCLDENAHNL